VGGGFIALVIFLLAEKLKRDVSFDTIERIVLAGLAYT
jgi:hypothetical protein